MEISGTTGSVYVFMGADALGEDLDLRNTNYNNRALWKIVPETDITGGDYNLNVSPSE